MAASASTSRVKTNENIQVYLRVRPMNDRERMTRCHEAVEVVSHREISVKQDNRNTKKFTFDRSFGQDSNQSVVHKSVVAPFIEEVLAGYNCTVFAYGQTGTGKTHTMIGEESPIAGSSWDEDTQVGIIPRAVNHLFEELRIMGVEFSMRISFLELYNEELTDLLAVSDQVPVRIYDDNSKKGSIIVHGLEELPVHSSADVYKLLAKGQDKRKTASTIMNVQSSRSHTIFSILVHIREYNADGEEVLKVGKLNLVDLAGSENISKAGNEKGIRTRETVNINQSLLTLGRVITALVERAPHIPYRESKLTRLLQESLGGRTKTSIIATVSPGHRDLEETLSTLEYAHRAKNIQNKPEINQKLTKKLALKEYSEEIDRLKRDLMASRSKNGIYLAEETYAEMTGRLEAQNKELSEKQTTIKVLKDEMAKVQTVFNEVSLNLVEKETELAETYETLHSTKAELGQTVRVLRNASKRYQEKKECLANHIHTEQVLRSQAKELKNVADIASSDTHLLQDTLERRKMIDNNILSVCDSFERSMQNNINEMTTEFDSYNNEIDNQSKIIVEYVATSMVRNTNFSDTVLVKLTEQRQQSIMNEIQVKELLRDTLTNEMNLTSENVELISNIMKQSIEDERKFNEGLCNELQKLSTVIDVQNENFLETNSILKVVCESINEFTNVQKTKLQTLSVDTGNLLENYRSSAIDAISKNTTIVENVSKALEDLKVNTENMKINLPTISEAMEMVKNTTQDQIELTDKTAKSSEELKEKITKEKDDIKNKGETNRREISKIVESVNIRTKLFAASLKSSKCKLREQFEKQKKFAKTAFNNVERMIADGNQNIKSGSTDITNVIDSEVTHIKGDGATHLSFKSSLSSIVQRFSESSKKKLDDFRNVVVDFHRKDLKVYAPSGATPAKREFNYPKVLAATSPHDNIIRRFWSAHNESDLDISASILEGNETVFINGMNEVQSSSMVQPADAFLEDVMSSSMVQSSSIEQKPIATVMETIHEGQPLSPIVPQSISNRVLSEISVTMTNSPTLQNVNKKPSGTSFRDAITSSDQNSNQNTEMTTNLSSSDSNKENA